MVSVGVVTAIITAIFSGIALVVGKVWGRKTAEITLKPPMPEVTTRSAKQYAENAALLAHEGRTAESLAQVAQDIDQIHTRINAAFHKLDTLDGSVEGIREITGKLLDLALHLPQGTSAIRSRKPRP